MPSLIRVFHIDLQRLLLRAAHLPEPSPNWGVPKSEGTSGETVLRLIVVWTFNRSAVRRGLRPVAARHPERAVNPIIRFSLRASRAPWSAMMAATLFIARELP